MPGSPICKSCLVCRGVEEFLGEYIEFLETHSHQRLAQVSTHARGFKQGQLSVANEVTSELSDLLPYLVTEKDLRRLGKGQ